LLKFRFRFGVAAILFFAARLTFAAAPLSFCFEDVEQRPWTLPAGVGLNFELLTRVEKQLGEKFEFSSKPWKRCIEEVRVGHMDGVFAAADSEERRSFAVVPTLPDGRADPNMALYSESYNVYLRVGGHASWDGNQLVMPDGSVAVQTGYIVSDLLRQRGFRVSEGFKSAADGLRLLANGAFDVAILHGHEAHELAKDDPRFRTRVTQAPIPYVVMPFFLMVGRKAYDQDPKRIEAIWRTIGAVRHSAEYQKLEAASGLGR
jgi:polar amino acid transport system substrate-binding protein